jgi:ubiquinone biosynthesis protein COQ4
VIAAAPLQKPGLKSGKDYHGKPLRPLVAMRAFRRLVADKEDTAQVFEIINALTGRSIPDGYIKLTRRAGEIAYRRQELSGQFADAAWLDGFAPGTVGAAYREFMRTQNLSIEHLAEESERILPEAAAPHVYAWYARRLRDIHDVWHVLTGYGRDALGEACVVSFSHAQTRNLGFAFIGAAAARSIGRGSPGVPAWRAVREAWRNGKQAAWLPGEDYAALFAEPLEDARVRLGIPPASIYQAVPSQVRDAIKLHG